MKDIAYDQHRERKPGVCVCGWKSRDNYPMASHLRLYAEFEAGQHRGESQGQTRARERSESIRKNVKWEADWDAQMGYLTLTDHEIVRTKELYGGFLIDVDAEGQVVGIEVFL